MSAPQQARLPASPKGRRDGEVVMISRQARLEWIDALSADPDLSHVAVRVACIIGQHFNRHTGDTFIKQDTIAARVRVSERTVWSAIRELEARGWLIVKRRELGVRASDGRRICGGKGVANVYLPAVHSSQLTATNAGRMLATGCDLSAPKARSPLRPLDPQSSQNPTPKLATGCDPTLNLPSEGNPTRARGRAREDAPPAHALGAAGDRLLARLGKATFVTWFEQLRVEGASDGCMTLSAPSRFHRDWVMTHFSEAMRDCWSSEDRAIRQVEVVVRS